MIAVRRFIAVLASALTVVLSGAVLTAHADSWRLPVVTTYESAQGTTRFTVTPRSLVNQLEYFEDKVDGAEPAGQALGQPSVARGKLERRDADGQWRVIWDEPLVNDVSPVSALVSEHGDYAVTFDNWHSTGWGDDAIVIYGGRGNVIRAMALTDFLPEAYFEALPRSVSSIQWSGEHRIEGERLILQVVVPDGSAYSDRTYLEVAVELATGQVQAPKGEAWDTALLAAAETNRQRAEAQARWRAERIAPLLGPTSAAERDWHYYLREAFYRLHEGDLGDLEYAGTETKVLRDPAVSDYAPSLGWLRKALLERTYAGTVSIGSPVESNLVAVITALGGEIPLGSLAGSTIYVAVGDTAWPTVRDALVHSGAVLHQLDPSEPIAQRPDRMPK